MINARIVTSDVNTVNICRSKLKTYEYLKDEVFIPKYYNNIDDVNNYPVFIKPKVGQGAKGTKIIESKQELQLFFNEKNIICEYLPGDEYTIDCFTDKNGILKYLNIRSRDRIRTGISVRTTRINITSEIKNIAQKINNKFNFNGAW